MLNDRLLVDVDAHAAGKLYPDPREIGLSHPLDDLSRFLRQFVAYPDAHCLIAHVLWIAHTHAMHAWESTPRLAFLSPEPGSGKSRALEVTELVVPNPVEAINVTPAYLFRKVGSEDGAPTLLYDEIDTVFGPRAKENEEIRGLLNAGHRKHSKAGRCVVRGKQVFTEEIPAYCAVALAGLGGLPDTILTRSVIVRMRRRAPHEMVTPFRRRQYEQEGYALRDRLALWMQSVDSLLVDAWPDMPEGIHDRNADVWEALLAVADAAGGDWPERARVAAVSLVTQSQESTPSLGVRLLADLRTVFGDAEHVPTDAIIKRLCAMDESPWSDIRGKPIDSRGIAARLRGYGISSKVVRIGEHTFRGYRRADLHDAWARYLPVSPATSVTSETCETDSRRVTDVADVTHAADESEGF